jgi:hypothetical protein
MYFVNMFSVSKDDEIDLKLLGKVLAPESTVFEVRNAGTKLLGRPTSSDIELFMCQTWY